MAIVNLPSATGAKTLPEVIDVVENMRKTVEFLLTNVDSDNITAIDSSKTDITQLKIDSLNLKDLAVTSAKIGIAEILEAHIGLAQIKEAHIANAQIKTAHIVDANITTAKIADASITNAKIDRASVNKLVVGTADIANAAITNAKIENLSVTTAKIADASITNAKIDRASVNKLVVDTADIKDLSVTTAKIANAAIGTSQISDASITDAKIVTLTANKLTAGVIDASVISVTNLVADNIVTGTLTIASANLSVNTDFRDLTNIRLVNVTASTEEDTVLGKVLVLTKTTTGSAYADLPRFAITGGKKITIQALLKRGANLNSFGDNLYLRTSTTASPSATDVYTYNGTLSVNWTNHYVGMVGDYMRVVATFDVPVGVISGFISFRHAGAIVAGTDTSAYFGKVMVSYGNLAPEWQPHTNELLIDKGILNLHIADNAVTNRVIQAETITGDRLVANTITADQIAARTITANEMVLGTITAASGILANASIVTATIADLAVTNAKINTLDATKITTGTLDAGRIGASSITAEKILIGDFANYATVNEFLPNSGFSNAFGEVIPDSTNQVIKKGDLTVSYLMFCNYTPSTFKTGDVLYYEFYAKTVGVASDDCTVNAWGYSTAKSYLSINNNTSITVTSTEQLFTGTITLSHASWANAAYFLVGIGGVANVDIQIRQVKVYRKMHGSLLVEGSITATNGIIASIDASKITTGTLNAERVGVSFGGRNLIKHTDFVNDWNSSWWIPWSSGTQSPTLVDITLDSGEVLKTQSVRSSQGPALNHIFAIQTRGSGTASAEKFSLVAGQEYTLSFLSAVHGNAYNDFRYTYILNDGLSNNQQLSGSQFKKTAYGTFTSPFGLTMYLYEITFTATYTCPEARLLLGTRVDVDLTSTTSIGLFYFTKLMLEEGNKRSTWRTAPEDTYGEIARHGEITRLGTYIDSTGVYTGKISFNQGEGGTLKLGDPYGSGVLEVWSDVNTDGIPDMVGRIDTVGAYFPNLSADSVRGDVENAWTLGNKTYYFDNVAGNDSNSGTSWALAKKNMQNFIDSMPKNLNRYAITLNFRNDIYGGLTILGFRNGDLYILGNLNGSSVRARTFGRIVLNNIADGAFTFQSFDAHGDPETVGTGVFNATHVNVFKTYDINVYGNSKASHGFALNNVKFAIGECEVYGLSDRGLSVVGMSQGYWYNCRGSAPIAVYVNEASVVSGVGTRWSGTVSRQNNSMVGSYNSGGTAWVNDVWTINTGSTAPAAPAPSTETTLTLAASTGDNYSTSGYWTNDEVKQGNWGYGDRYGLWYADLNAVKAKTIVSATITVYRGSGGSSQGRNIQFRAHNYYSRATRPAGTPSMSTAYARGPIAPGQTITFDITDLVSAQIAGGSYRAIGVYTTGSTDYMSLGTTPTITVRYK